MEHENSDSATPADQPPVETHEPKTEANEAGQATCAAPESDISEHVAEVADAVAVKAEAPEPAASDLEEAQSDERPLAVAQAGSEASPAPSRQPTGDWSRPLTFCRFRGTSARRVAVCTAISTRRVEPATSPDEQRTQVSRPDRPPIEALVAVLEALAPCQNRG